MALAAAVRGSQRYGRSGRRCGRATSAQVARPDCRSWRGMPRAEPTSAIAAHTGVGSSKRRATAHWTSGEPVATMSTRSASISSGECSQDRQRDRRLIGRQRPHDRRRRVGGLGEDFGHRLAHQRRRVVEQQQQRPFGRGEIVGRHLGEEPGPGQGARRFRALGCRSRTNPTEKMPDNHRHST